MKAWIIGGAIALLFGGAGLFAYAASPVTPEPVTQAPDLPVTTNGIATPQPQPTYVAPKPSPRIYLAPVAPLTSAPDVTLQPHTYNFDTSQYEYQPTCHQIYDGSAHKYRCN